MGVWVATDGGRLELSADGSMRGEKLRTEIPFEISPPLTVAGTGTWRLISKPAVWKLGAYWWDVELHFDHLEGVKTKGMGDQIVYGPSVPVLGPKEPVLQFWPDAEPSERSQEFVRRRQDSSSR